MFNSVNDFVSLFYEIEKRKESHRLDFRKRKIKSSLKCSRYKIILNNLFIFDMKRRI